MKSETLNKLTALMAVLAISSGVLFTATLVMAQENYLYVDNTGSLSVEPADTPREAITEADDIKYNSGVIDADAYAALRGSETVTVEMDSVTADDETYLYVSANGDIESEMADTPREAITEADDIKYNSGVIDAESYYELTSESIVATSVDSNTGGEMYLYVTADGELALESADTPREAINEADDIKYNSGVIDADAYAALSQ